MAKKTYQSTDGTSFFGTTIFASVNQLIRSFGEPSFENNTGEDKVNFEWEMETDEGEVFTIYDWKEYTSIREDRMIEWHIGGKSERVTNQAKRELLNQL
jgi:hypothetical protein